MVLNHGGVCRWTCALTSLCTNSVTRCLPTTSTGLAGRSRKTTHTNRNDKNLFKLSNVFEKSNHCYCSIMLHSVNSLNGLCITSMIQFEHQIYKWFIESVWMTFFLFYIECVVEKGLTVLKFLNLINPKPHTSCSYITCSRTWTIFTKSSVSLLQHNARQKVPCWMCNIWNKDPISHGQQIRDIAETETRSGEWICSDMSLWKAVLINNIIVLEKLVMTHWNNCVMYGLVYWNYYEFTRCDFHHNYATFHYSQYKCHSIDHSS